MKKKKTPNELSNVNYMNLEYWLDEHDYDKDVNIMEERHILILIN